MSNHFPTIPSLNLLFVKYTATWNTGAGSDLSYFDVSGVVPLEIQAGPGIFALPDGPPANPIMTVPFNFSTPGDAGSFDQDAAEAKVATVLDDIAQAVATASGNDLATVQAWITVQRQWLWMDEGRLFFLTYDNDTMTYPG